MRILVCAVALMALAAPPALAEGKDTNSINRDRDLVETKRGAATPRMPDRIVDMGDGDLI